MQDLKVQGFSQLEECLGDFFKKEELTGDNRYACDSCGMKTDAERGIELLELPSVLNLQLMRFVYDVKSNSRKKIHTPITFPLTLDLTEYCASLRNESSHASSTSDAGSSSTRNTASSTSGGVFAPGTKNTGKKRKESGSDSPVNIGDVSVGAGCRNGAHHDSSSQRILFDLEAVVLHSGTKASEGHYIAYARGGDQRLWWKYDDGYVCSLQSDEFFGTPDTVSKANKKRKDKEAEELKDRIKNKEAYMLIYKRRMPGGDRDADVDVPVELADPIRQKSQQVLEVPIAFDYSMPRHCRSHIN